MKLPIEKSKNSSIILRKNCSQLFVIFTGIGRGINILGFYKEANILDRNLLMLKEEKRFRHNRGYMNGIDRSIYSDKELANQINMFVKKNKHIKEVYCWGVSSGAFGALAIGSQINANRIWAFALNRLYKFQSKITWGIKHPQIISLIPLLNKFKNSHKNTYLYNSSFIKQDRKVANEIKNNTEINVIPMPYESHNVVPILLEQGRFSEIIPEFKGV